MEKKASTDAESFMLIYLFAALLLLLPFMPLIIWILLELLGVETYPGLAASG